MIDAATTVHQVDRATVQRWLRQLDDWLLPESCYSVQHTWPQLYRSDGEGMFFVATQGERLLSHCAVRLVELRQGATVLPIALLGSVATDPELRGHGLATQALTAALDAIPARIEQVLLWAERPELYARLGFAPTDDDVCLLLVRRPRRHLVGVRPAELRDHAALHALHAAKPMHVERTPGTMATLLSTPGMTTVVLERDGRPVAYACCGKGADLHGHWHELGGSDADLALLLPEAMHFADQIEAALLLPPYRDGLRALLGDQIVGEIQVAGPMARGIASAPRRCWIDGLDSV